MRSSNVINSESSVQSLLGRDRTSVPPKKVSAMVPVLVGLVLVLVGLALFRMMAPQQTAAKTVQIVGAGQDIFPGSRITFHDLHYITIPESYYSEGMSSKTNLLVGRIARNFIGKGEPVQESYLFSGRDNLAQKVENHERAVTLKLDDYALVDHTISSGDQVDVLVTTTLDGKKFTKTVCQSVKVLFSMPREALHSSSLRGQEANHITLVVSPGQAELLAQAEETGKIKLSLRNRLATGQPFLSGVSESDLLPDRAKELSAARFSANAKVPATTATSTTIPAPPQMVPTFAGFAGLPMPPIFANNTNSAAGIDVMAPVTRTARWVVEIFSGNKRELYEVPEVSK